MEKLKLPFSLRVLDLEVKNKIKNANRSWREVKKEGFSEMRYLHGETRSGKSIKKQLKKGKASSGPSVYRNKNR